MILQGNDFKDISTNLVGNLLCKALTLQHLRYRID